MTPENILHMRDYYPPVEKVATITELNGSAIIEIKVDTLSDSELQAHLQKYIENVPNIDKQLLAELPDIVNNYASFFIKQLKMLELGRNLDFTRTDILNLLSFPEFLATEIASRLVSFHPDYNSDLPKDENTLQVKSEPRKIINLANSRGFNESLQRMKGKGLRKTLTTHLKSFTVNDLLLLYLHNDDKKYQQLAEELAINSSKKT